MNRLFLIPLVLGAQLACAGMVLDPASSLLNFTSIKNNLVAEIHQFTVLDGTLGDKGELTVNVNLDSVNTRVDVRDERMRETLFETGKFPLATYKATIDLSNLENMQAGEVQQQRVKGTIDLHGKQGTLEFLVRIVKSNSGALLVSTVEPAFINADQFDLKVGILKLRSMVGLKSIARAVPVTFSVVFQQAEKKDDPKGKNPAIPKLLPFGK